MFNMKLIRTTPPLGFPAPLSQLLMTWQAFKSPRNLCSIAPQLLRLYFGQISNNAWENPSKKSPSPPKKGFTFKQVKQFFTSEHFYCCERTLPQWKWSTHLFLCHHIRWHPQPIPWRNKIIIFKFSGFQFGSVRFSSIVQFWRWRCQWMKRVWQWRCQSKRKHEKITTEPTVHPFQVSFRSLEMDGTVLERVDIVTYFEDTM